MMLPLLSQMLWMLAKARKKRELRSPRLILVTLVATVLPTASSNTPPVLVVIPRQWKIPVNEMVGHPVAEVRVTHFSPPDEITYEISASGNSHTPIPGNIKDGAPYFSLHQRGPNALKVYLTKSLEEDLKPGDHLTLSISAHSGSFTTRHEVSVVVEEPHINPFAVTIPPIPGTSNVTTHDHYTTTTSRAVATETIVMKGPEEVQQEQEASQEADKMTKEQMAAEASRKYVLILVPIVLVCPAVGFGIWFFRRQIDKAGRRLCNCTRKHDMDVKIEDADGEFSHELQRKSVTSSEGLRKVSTTSAAGGAAAAAAAHLYKSSPSNSNAAEGEMQIPDDLAWEFPRHQLKFVSMIGEGCFGQVWKYETESIAEMEGPSTVAVKTLRSSATEKEKKDLLHELSVMKMLDPHPNVVRLLGCCTEKDPIFIILEFVNGGTLQDYLRKNRSQHNYRNLHGESQTLTARDLTSFAFQIAKGMAYLSSKKVIHRDLAARNILIDEEKQACKVADFGFARDVMANNIYERKSEGRLPIRWMAPESLYDNCYTTKSDVWSFGVLMWEIVALGATPYPGKSASEVMKFVRDGGRLEKPPHCDRQLYNIMSYCWSREPDDRPQFDELVQDFERLLVEDTDYIDLNMFPEHAYYNEVSLSDEKV